MSTNRPPAGRQPQSVYIRRRLMVLGILVVVVVVVILIIVRPGSGKPTAANTHTPAAHTNSSTNTGKVSTCKDSDIQVIAVTDATSYAAGVDPMLSMSITNTGATACKFDVGTSVQNYVITSGTDLIWESKDCQTNASSDVITLTPNKTLKSTPFAWKRTRSSPTTCSATNPPQVIAKGASYHLAVTVNGVTSSAADSPQFVLR